MTRFNLYLTDKQRKELAALAKRDEVKVAELVRRAVDLFLQKSKEGEQ